MSMSYTQVAIWGEFFHLIAEELSQSERERYTVLPHN